MKDFRLPIVFSLVFLIVTTVVVFSIMSDEESITLSVSSEPIEVIEPVLKTNVVAKTPLVHTEVWVHGSTLLMLTLIIFVVSPQYFQQM